MFDFNVIANEKLNRAVIDVGAVRYVIEMDSAHCYSALIYRDVEGDYHCNSKSIYFEMGFETREI